MHITVRLRTASLIMAGCILAGCHTAQPPIKRADLVGTYVYHSEDPEGRPTDHEWDRLTLRADGKYDLVQGGPTKPRTETIGAWTLYQLIATAHGPAVGLAHLELYPVEMKRNQMRLLIDEDTGIWYAKVK